MASAAFACGAISGTFTVKGDNGVSVTSTSVNDPADATHQMQALSGGTAVSCGALPSGGCALGQAGTIQISTGSTGGSGNPYLAPSATATPAGTCAALGTAINQCADAGTPAPLTAPTLGPYFVRYLNGPVYGSHTANNYGTAVTAIPNCGFYGNGNGSFLSVDLGTVTVGSSASDTSGTITALNSSKYGGSYAGGVVKLNLPPSVQNVSPAESAVCIVDRLSHEGNIVPLTIG